MTALCKPTTGDDAAGRQGGGSAVVGSSPLPREPNPEVRRVGVDHLGLKTGEGDDPKHPCRHLVRERTPPRGTVIF
ncbi:MAG: hypothetical protein ABSH04_05235 [Acidimicrobiales bacterium]|jgi:hypothetical protein